MFGLHTPLPRLTHARAASVSAVVVTGLVLGILGIGAFLATMLRHHAHPKVTLRAEWPQSSTSRPPALLRSLTAQHAPIPETMP